MKRLAVLIVTIAICLSERPCSSQSISLHSNASLDKLPSSEVYTIFQDSKGFMWFGTDNGVCRFDGEELEVFHVKDGLTDPVVFGISEDHKGRIWFRTYSGKISYYENGKIIPFKYNDVLHFFCKTRILYSLYYDSLDRLWFSAGHFIGNIDAAGKVDTTYSRFYSMQIQEVEGHPLYTYSGAIDALDNVLYEGKYRPLKLQNTGPLYHVICAVRWRGRLYFTVTNNIYEISAGKVRHVKQTKGLIIYLSTDKDNNLWIGYLHHGAELFTTSFEKESVSLFEDKSITSIVKDHEGGVWFSSLESGAHYLPNLQVINIPNDPEKKITAVLFDEFEVVTGNFAGDIEIYDARSGKLKVSRALGHPIITVFRPRNGDYWISHIGGLTIWNKNLETKKTGYGSKMAFAQRRSGEILSTSAFSIARYKEDGASIEYLRNENLYRTIMIADSLTFAGGRSGLHILDAHGNVLKSIAALENVKIRVLENLNDSLIFIGTLGNGFFLLNKHSWKASQYHSEQNFHADNIYSLAMKDSLMWIGTDRGIAMSPVPNTPEEKLNFKFLNRRNGLMGDKVNFIATTKNEIWAFSDEGTSKIPYEAVRFANTTPRFHLMNIQIDDQMISPAPHLRLTHTQNNILLTYKKVSFNNDHILTRYRLRKESPWLYSDSRSLLFSSLAPGEYKFELQYSGDNDDWRSALEPIAITIIPPWWNRLYVQLCALSAIMLLGYLYFKYLRSIYRQKNHYLQIINDHQQKLLQSEIVTVERERNRISKELHDRVGTNLTAIKLMVSQLLKSHKDPMAPDVEEQFQLAIREIKEIIYGLTPPSLERYGLFTGLKNYIGKLNKSIPLNISLKTFGNEINKYEINIILFRVLQELITNSIKHSFAKNVTIHINSFEDILNIVYEDDGIGFSYDPLQGGLGLDSIESRINSLCGNLRFDSGEFGISYTIDIPVNQNKAVV